MSRRVTRNNELTTTPTKANGAFQAMQLVIDFNCASDETQEKSSSVGVPPKGGTPYEALLVHRRASSCYVQAKTRQPESLDLVKRDARMAALQTLMEPIKGKTRKLYVFDREMMLLDKAGAGGVPIQEVDDATAAHYFLEWLHGQRTTESRCATSDSEDNKKAKFI
jgi:hypothetical protein